MRARNCMRRVACWLALAASASFISACYRVRLEPVPAAGAGAPVPVAATGHVPEQTATREHTVHSGLAGFANSWTVDVGRAVAEYARAYLGHAFPGGSDVTVRVDLLLYDVKGFAATT